MVHAILVILLIVFAVPFAIDLIFEPDISYSKLLLCWLGVIGAIIAVIIALTGVGGWLTTVLISAFIFGAAWLLERPERVRKWPVSKRVNSSRAPDDDASLIEVIDDDSRVKRGELHFLESMVSIVAVGQML